MSKQTVFGVSYDHDVEAYSTSSTAIDPADTLVAYPSKALKHTSYSSRTQQRLARLSRTLTRRRSTENYDQERLEEGRAGKVSPEIVKTVKAVKMVKTVKTVKTVETAGITEKVTEKPANRLPDFEVTFAQDDPAYPPNWPLWYRGWVVLAVTWSCWVVVVYSTSYCFSYASVVPGIEEEELAGGSSSSSTDTALLGMTTYLLGLAAGAMVVAPLSELVGRRVVFLGGIVCFTLLLLLIPSVLATSLALPGTLAVRFFAALFGSALVTNGPAVVCDISSSDNNNNNNNRTLYLSILALAPMNGPVTGPIVGGFLYEYLGWRWDTSSSYSYSNSNYNYGMVALSALAVVVLLTVRETYAPAILRARAARVRKDTGDGRYWCRYDEQQKQVTKVMATLCRPIVLAATEPILWLANAWMAVVYGIMYVCIVVAYPVVFGQYRGWGPGMSGLAYCGIAVGNTLAIAAAPLLRRGSILGGGGHVKDSEASTRIMVLAALLSPLGLLVFAWTGPAVSHVHWAVPVASGIPFGAGNTLAFIYGIDYLTKTYGSRYAASALAGNMVLRSVLAGVLPLAGAALYDQNKNENKTLSPQWAGTLLGVVLVCVMAVPLVLWRYGRQMRARSRVVRELGEDDAEVVDVGKTRKTMQPDTVATALAGDSRYMYNIDIEGGAHDPVRSEKTAVPAYL